MSHADFLTAPFDAPVDLPDLDPSSASRFYNRELSWLGFNWRVVQEAENPRVPLLERIRFLSISADNLDEFCTVRVAGLRELARAGNTTPGIDGLSPAQQLVEIDENIRNLMHTQQRVLGELHEQMQAQNISILEINDLTDEDRAYLHEFFLSQVFAVLSPLAIDPAHPFPFIPNTGYALALQLQRKSDKRNLQALLPIPAQIDRFIAIPSESGHRFLPLDSLLVLKISDLFPG
jgi:polyphosphate kinase